VADYAITIEDVKRAAETIRGQVLRTPLVPAPRLSQLTGATVFVKHENMQPTGSFKERGAATKLESLTEAERKRGVIAMSAGNHAQAVAYHARRLGIPATIVMPESTPLVKAENTRSYGAKVILEGETLYESAARAREIADQEGLVFVHPYDDPRIMAGQGTIGLEMLADAPDLDQIVVPIGGGGLISGIAAALKMSKPGIRVIGVQTAVLPSMKVSVEAGEPVTIPAAQTIADGIAVKRPGGRTLEYVKRWVDEIITVDEEEIANAILLLLEREKTVVEGAGAVTLAALLHGYCRKVEGENVVLVLSGGNIDMNLISRIIERGLVKGGRLNRFVVNVQDRPGSLARLTALVAEQQANIIEIHHDRAFGKSGYGETEVLLTLETRGRSHVEQIHAALEAAGYRISDRS